MFCGRMKDPVCTNVCYSSQLVHLHALGGFPPKRVVVRFPARRKEAARARGRVRARWCPEGTQRYRAGHFQGLAAAAWGSAEAGKSWRKRRPGAGAAARLTRRGGGWLGGGQRENGASAGAALSVRRDGLDGAPGDNSSTQQRTAHAAQRCTGALRRGPQGVAAWMQARALGHPVRGARHTVSRPKSSRQQGAIYCGPLGEAVGWVRCTFSRAWGALSARRGRECRAGVEAQKYH